jgi:integrase
LTVASDLRNHIEPFFGERTIDRITPDDIERYAAVKKRTLAIKTIRNHIGTMHSVFEVGLRKGWCQSNPVKLADRPVIRTTETRIKFLDQDELEKLLAVPYPDDAFGHLEPTLYLTAAMTGLRQGELLGLRWRDIDFEARRVRVVSPFVRGEFGDPKSTGSGRSVPLAERAAVALRSHGQPARPLEARSSLQAGHRARRRPPRHLPRTTPHLRDAHGRCRHAATDATALAAASTVSAITYRANSVPGVSLMLDLRCDRMLDPLQNHAAEDLRRITTHHSVIARCRVHSKEFTCPPLR